MLKILEYIAYGIVVIQIIMISGGSGSIKTIIIYAFTFFILLAIEYYACQLLNLRFEEGGVSWIYVISLIINAGISHQVSGRVAQKRGWFSGIWRSDHTST